MISFNNMKFYNIFIAQRMCVLLAELIQTFFLFIFFFSLIAGKHFIRIFECVYIVGISSSALLTVTSSLRVDSESG